MHTWEQLRAGQLAGIQRLTMSQGLRTFPEEVFSLADTLEILDLSGNELASPGRAEAEQHLHAHGLMHGDLYAHNILYDETGYALLGDFGAASSSPGNAGREALALQRIEVRAYACELLARCTSATADLRVYSLQDKLGALQLRCVSDISAGPPLFAEITRESGGLSCSF